MNSFFKFPEFAIKTNYKTPVNPTDGSLQHAYSTEHNFFEHLETHQPYGAQFNQHMGGYRQGRPSWMDKGFYPVQERLINGFDAASPALLVDIGGGLGHDLDEFRRKNLEAPGKLVLQDLGPVLGQITDLDSKIERMEYNFYDEQPVKGT
ncbi:hypothetical protein IMZ48_37955 [Candidatus Bathyarchaeota archaeon]|nr:hypothetical protein [Candidatus Bathyarchaeota archaeon]